MNEEFTNCNDCRFYDTCGDDNYPCNNCSHGYPDRFESDTTKKIEHLESLVTQRGARMKEMLKHIKENCPFYNQGYFEKVWFKDGEVL